MTHSPPHSMLWFREPCEYIINPLRPWGPASGSPEPLRPESSSIPLHYIVDLPQNRNALRSPPVILRTPPYALCATLNFQPRCRAVCRLDINQIGNTAQASSWCLQPCMRPEVLQKVVLVAQSIMATFAKSPFSLQYKEHWQRRFIILLIPILISAKATSTTRHPSCNVP
jgi:hypothetical protein